MADIGQNVTPGLDPEDFEVRNELTERGIADNAAALAAELEAGVAGLGIQEETLNLQQKLGLRDIQNAQRTATKQVVGQGLERNILRSGITQGAIQDVASQAGQARALLSQDTALGLMNIQSMIQQLNNEYGLGLSSFASQFASDAYMTEQLGTYGVAGGFAGLSGGTAGNVDPQNVAAAQAGTGVYGERALEASRFRSMVTSQYGLSVDQWRDIGVQPEGGSATSDHYTGGAVDIMINPNDPQQLAAGQALLKELAMMRDAGIVSGWIWHPDEYPSMAEHGDHIHVSFALQGGTADLGSVSVSGIQTQPAPTASGSNLPKGVAIT